MIVLMAALGAAAGFLALLISRKLIASRMGQLPPSPLVSRRFTPLAWCALSSAGYAVICLAADGPLEAAESAAVLTLCLCVGAVDWVSKKIPNPLLLALIVSKAAFLAVRHDMSEVRGSLWGFAAAAVIFAIPAFFRIGVGAGDIKLAAVTGLYLGIVGFLQAMIIMAVLITFYGVYLKIRKRGGFRTKTAMGPYLAFGLICTLVFPIAL